MTPASRVIAALGLTLSVLSAAGAASPDRRIRRRGTCTPMAVTIAANTMNPASA